MRSCDFKFEILSKISGAVVLSYLQSFLAQTCCPAGKSKRESDLDLTYEFAEMEHFYSYRSQCNGFPEKYILIICVTNR